MLRSTPVLVSLLLTGCLLVPSGPLSESEAQLRVRRALRDLETAGFHLRGSFDVAWKDRAVRCASGHVCISPDLDPDGGGTLVVAPRVIESDARLRLALLEVWQRLADGVLDGPRAFTRGTLRQLISGDRVGVSDPVLLGEVLTAYAAYRDALSEEERRPFPEPGFYSRSLGLFFVPVPLAEPSSDGAAPSLAPRGLGAVAVAPCRERERRVYPDLPGVEGRRAYWNGFCAVEMGELESGVAHLLEAERWLPHDPRVPLELGSALCRFGRPEAATLAFARAAERSPDPRERADAYRGIARCRLRASDFDGTREAYARVLTLDPDDVLTADWLRWLEGRVFPTAQPTESEE